MSAPTDRPDDPNLGARGEWLARVSEAASGLAASHAPEQPRGRLILESHDGRALVPSEPLRVCDPDAHAWSSGRQGLGNCEASRGHKRAVRRTKSGGWAVPQSIVR